MKIISAIIIAISMFITSTAHAFDMNEHLNNRRLLTLTIPLGKHDTSQQSFLNVGGLFGVAGEVLRTAWRRPIRLHAVEGKTERRKRIAFAIGATVLTAAVLYEEHRKRESKRDARRKRDTAPTVAAVAAEKDEPSAQAEVESQVNVLEPPQEQEQEQLPPDGGLPVITTPQIIPPQISAPTQASSPNAETLPKDVGVPASHLLPIPDSFRWRWEQLHPDLQRLIRTPVPADAKPATGHEVITFGTRLSYRIPTGFCATYARCNHQIRRADGTHYLQGRGEHRGRKFSIWFGDEVGNIYAVADDEPRRRYYWLIQYR